MKRTIKRIVLALVVAGIAVATVIAFRPKPTQVEGARAVRGPLQVTIDEDGETRAKDRFTLAAPVTGRLSRITLREGDAVGPDTVLATISPLPLDPRELAEIRAQVQSAEALERQAAEQMAQAATEHAQTQRELARISQLGRDKLVAQQDVEKAESKEASAAKALAAAEFHAKSASAEVARARSGLISLEAQQHEAGKVVSIRPPVPCRILRILEKSERVVPSGTPIVVLSNPQKIEIVVDLLSSDAVKVHAGTPAIIENWGGDHPLRARVRTVEPYGFTKVSALGIEEQRANVIADFVDAPDGLGDGYRVDARIVIWESPSVLKVPASALFRAGQCWNVFVADQGRAHLVPVEVGHRNTLEAEITKGTSAGVLVILHPPNSLKEGMKVTMRGS